MPATAYIGIGSNLTSSAGSPAQAVRAAIDSLGSAGEILAQSSLYRTAPVDYQDQPAFVNAAAAIRTNLQPEALLEALLAIEHAFGRDRATGIPKGTRTLDLDLLLMTEEDGNGLLCQSPSLTLPHPEIACRRFVLAPLAEIAPELVHPTLHRTIGALLEELPGEGPNSAGAIEMLAR